jgi:glycerol-3-phosphate dehydrogenase (NAD(P)+)
MGTNPRSFIGVAGIGDFMATSHASASRNVRAGQLIGQGHSVGKAEARIKQTVESFHTVPLLRQRMYSATGERLSELSQTVNKY